MKGTDYMMKSNYKTNNFKSTKDWQQWSNETIKTLWNNNKQLVQNRGPVKLVTGKFNKYDGISQDNLLDTIQYIIEFKHRTLPYFDIRKGVKVVNSYVREGMMIECGVVNGKLKHNEKYENLIQLGKDLNKIPLYASVLNDGTIILHDLSKIPVNELKYSYIWVKDQFNQYEKHEEKYGTAFIRFDKKSYLFQKEWAPGFYGEKLPKIQCQLKKPVYLLTEEQGETYFKHV
jgi:hypothetical protein